MLPLLLMLVLLPSDRHVHDFLVRTDEAVAHFGERAKRDARLLHLQHHLRQLDAGHALLELRRERVGALLRLIDLVDALAAAHSRTNSRLDGACDAPLAPASCFSPSGAPPAPRTCDCMERIWREDGIDLHGMTCSSRPRRRLHAGAPACSAGARADAEALGRELAIAVVAAQRFENQVAFGDGQGIGQSELRSACSAAERCSRERTDTGTADGCGMRR